MARGRHLQYSSSCPDGFWLYYCCFVYSWSVGLHFFTDGLQNLLYYTQYLIV